jgi:hypothetical protein
MNSATTRLLALNPSFVPTGSITVIIAVTATTVMCGTATVSALTLLEGKN